jgi:shikimate dehydrogenase
MRIDTHTQLYGIIGRPLGHSLSPVMHNAAFEACKLNAVYLVFETLDPESVLRAVRALDIKGLSVTLPYKSAVIPLLDEVDPLAAKIGAVNTVVNQNGRLCGLNTDVLGGLKALQENQVEIQGKKCLLVGAGGVARALAWGLQHQGARLMITNRTAAKAEALARELGCGLIPWEKRADQQAEILIQATAAGMHPHTNECSIPVDCYKPGIVLLETIYNPLETKCLQWAQARGCRTINGLEMFIRQGAEQYRIWTGLEPPVEVMRKAVLASLKI